MNVKEVASGNHLHGISKLLANSLGINIGPIGGNELSVWIHKVQVTLVMLCGISCGECAFLPLDFGGVGLSCRMKL